MGDGLTYRDVYAKVQRTQRRKVLLIGGVILTVASLALAACLVLGGGRFDITGSVSIPSSGANFSGSICSSKGGFIDIREGAQVVVSDASSTTIAIGTLGRGEVVGGECRFPFTVSAPEGHDFYGIEVTHRGRLQYERGRLNQPLSLSLG